MPTRPPPVNQHRSHRFPYADRKGALKKPNAAPAPTLAVPVVTKTVSLRNVRPIPIPPIIRQCTKGNLSWVEKILKTSTPESREELLYTQDKDGNTPLMIAAKLGYRKLVNLLLKYSQPSDIKLKNNNGQTAVSLALAHEKWAIVQTLLDSLLQANAIDEQMVLEHTKTGELPLLWAYANGNAKKLKLLLQNIKDLAVLELLLKQTDALENTSLIVATASNNVPIFDVLLRFASDHVAVIDLIEAPNQAGFNLETLAKILDRERILSLLENAEVYVTQKGQKWIKSSTSSIVVEP